MDKVNGKDKRVFFFLISGWKNQSLNYGGDISIETQQIFVVSETYKQETFIQL